MMEDNINNEQFWKTKQLLDLDKKSQNFATLFMNNDCAESDMEKANMLNNYEKLWKGIYVNIFIIKFLKIIS